MECARGVVELMDFDCRGRDGLTLAFTAETGLPSSVLGDGHRLRQVLLNLVGNVVHRRGPHRTVVSTVEEPAARGCASSCETRASVSTTRPLSVCSTHSRG